MYERLGLVRLGGDGAGVSKGMWDEIRERDGRVFGVLIQSCASCKSCPDSGGQCDVVFGFAGVGSDGAAEGLF